MAEQIFDTRAGALAAEFHRPAITYALLDDSAVGAVRSDRAPHRIPHHAGRADTSTATGGCTPGYHPRHRARLSVLSAAIDVPGSI
jgi:hypothetical protein